MSPISIRVCVQHLVAVRRSCREERGGYRHTDSWHEWLQDNFYGGSATKRIVDCKHFWWNIPLFYFLCQIDPPPARVIFFPINAPGMGCFQLFNLVGWVWVRVRIWGRVRVTVRVIVTDRVRVSR